MTQPIIKIERLTEALALDMHELVTDYYAATPAHTDQPPYDFVWEVYQQLQDQDVLQIITARDTGNKLQGFTIYLITQHMHHRGWWIAECDTLAVHHSARGQGIGRLLLDASIAAIRERGVQTIMNRYRTCYGMTKPIFEEAGFKCVEHVYMLKMED